MSRILLLAAAAASCAYAQSPVNCKGDSTIYSLNVTSIVRVFVRPGHMNSAWLPNKHPHPPFLYLSRAFCCCVCP